MHLRTLPHDRPLPPATRPRRYRQDLAELIELLSFAVLLLCFVIGAAT